VVDEIVRCVHRAYDDVLPGLPYAELPVIAISGASFSPGRVHGVTMQKTGSSTSQGFIANVASRLETDVLEETEDEDPPPSSYITYLYPSDCANIMSAMKTLVTGFVDRPPAGQDGEISATSILHQLRHRAVSKTKTLRRRWPTTILNYSKSGMAFSEMPSVGRMFTHEGSNIDISEGPEPPPQLVVFLHDFEQFEEAVIRDLFHICRQARIFPFYDATQWSLF
jgi:origin recognition complex subunit 3